MPARATTSRSRRARPTAPTSPARATLAGTVNASYQSGTYTAKQYTILNATGGVSGTFGTLANTSLPSNVSAALSYDANNVYLNLTLNYMAPGGSLSGNQQNVSNALTNYFNATGGIPTAFAELCVERLESDRGRAGRRRAADGFYRCRPVHEQRVRQCVWQCERRRAYRAGRRRVRLCAGAQAVARGPRRLCRGDAARARHRSFEQRWGVWAAAYGGSASVNGDSTAGTHDTTSHVYGATAGADYRASEDTRFGFALGGAGSSFSLAEGFGSGKADIFNAALYGRQAFGASYVAARARLQLAGRLHRPHGDRRRHRRAACLVPSAGADGARRDRPPLRHRHGRHRRPMPACNRRPSSCRPTARPRPRAPTSSRLPMTPARSPRRAASSARASIRRVALGAASLTLKAKAAWAHDWNRDRGRHRHLPAASGRDLYGERRRARRRFRPGLGRRRAGLGWRLDFGGQFRRRILRAPPRATPAGEASVSPGRLGPAGVRGNPQSLVSPLGKTGRKALNRAHRACRPSLSARLCASLQSNGDRISILLDIPAGHLRGKEAVAAFC